MHHILWQNNPRGSIIIIATLYSSFIFYELSFSPTLEVRNALHFCLMFDLTEQNAQEEIFKNQRRKKLWLVLTSAYNV